MFDACILTPLHFACQATLLIVEDIFIWIYAARGMETTWWPGLYPEPSWGISPPSQVPLPAFVIKITRICGHLILSAPR